MYPLLMRAVEFVAHLKGKKAIAIPKEAADLLPSTGKAKVIVLFDADTSDNNWRHATYEQFMKDDSPEDSVYDRFIEDR
jgi:hypothetical protein